MRGRTGQRIELSNVLETGWKIEGMTDGNPGPKTLPEDPCADGERSVRPRYN